MIIKIKIAGIPVSLKTEDLDFTNSLKKRYRYFLCSGSHVAVRFIALLKCRINATITIKIEFLNVAQTFSKTRQSISGGRSAIPKILVSRNRLEIFHGNFYSKINLRTNHGKLKVDRNIFSIDSFLRILYSFLLLKNNGFLIHSTGILKNGCGYLFAGPTSSGKTTIARLSYPHLTSPIKGEGKGDTHLSSPLVGEGKGEGGILSDEVVAYKNERIYSTPFWGEFQKGKGNLNAKVSKLFFLKRGEEFRVERLSFKDAMRSLLKNVLFFNKESRFAEKLLQICENFVEEISCYNLYFYPTKSFWRKLKGLT